MKKRIVCLLSLIASSLAFAEPSWYAMLNTEEYGDGDASPSTAHASRYAAYYCTVAKAAELFNGASTVADVTAYFSSFFSKGKHAIEAGGEGMNSAAYYAGGQYSFSSAEYDAAVADGSYLAVAFYGEDAFRVFANDSYNTESGHVVFDDSVAGTAGEWITNVPEPTSGLLLLLGLAGIALKRKRGSHSVKCRDEI